MAPKAADSTDAPTDAPSDVAPETPGESSPAPTETPAEAPTEAPSDETPSGDETPATDPEICTACFPTGWPEGSTAAGCEHGQFTR